MARLSIQLLLLANVHAPVLSMVGKPVVRVMTGLLPVVGMSSILVMLGLT